MALQYGRKALDLARSCNRTDLIAMIEKVELGEDGCERGLESESSESHSRFNANI